MAIFVDFFFNKNDWRVPKIVIFTWSRNYNGEHHQPTFFARTKWYFFGNSKFMSFFYILESRLGFNYLILFAILRIVVEIEKQRSKNDVVLVHCE